MEEGKTFLGFIISPYFSTSDTHPSTNSMPKLRCFVNQVSKESGSIIPYEININILPQAKLYKDYLLKEIKELHDDPFSVDNINLRNETCVLKAKKS